MTVYRLTSDLIFPDPTMADPEGLLAVGGDLSVDRLILAYSTGIFPWYSDGQPILWWSPDPRLILYPDQFHISKSLKRIIKNNKFHCKADTQFERVIRHCSKVSRKGQHGTWITEEMIQAYLALHKIGFAHSIECYEEEELVGGLYGISMGAAFFGESMFSLKQDASKVAFATLIDKITSWGFHFVDCQVTTNHLLSLGACEISRDVFLEELYYAQQEQTRMGTWKLD